MTTTELEIMAKENGRTVDQQLKEEIRERNSDTFIPSEYEKLRRKGYTLKVLDWDYDLTHIFR